MAIYLPYTSFRAIDASMESTEPTLIAVGLLAFIAVVQLLLRRFRFARPFPTYATACFFPKANWLSIACSCRPSLTSRVREGKADGRCDRCGQRLVQIWRTGQR